MTFPGDAGGVIRGSPIVYCGEPNARGKEMEEKKKAVQDFVEACE